MNNGKYLVGVIVIVLIGVVSYFVFFNTKSYTYLCAGGKSLKTTFLDQKMTKLKVTLDDNHEYQLDQALSASGARYTNKDESVVFWNKGTTGFLTEKNIETYSACSIKE